MENNQLTTGQTGLNLFQTSKTTPKQYWITTQPKTALQAIKSESVSVVRLKDQPNGEIISKAFLSFIITDLVQSFNVGKTMNDMQIAFAVNGIQSDYYFMKLDELKYCFDQAKKGKYGAMYDRIDAAVIFEWIEMYLAERVELIISERQNENKIIKKNGSEDTNSIQNLMTDSRFVASAELKTKTNTNTPNENLKPLDVVKLPYHDVHQKWMAQFDKLRFDDRFVVPKTNDRFIKRYGKIINLAEFCDIKLEQLRAAKERNKNKSY